MRPKHCRVFLSAAAVFLLLWLSAADGEAQKPSAKSNCAALYPKARFENLGSPYDLQEIPPIIRPVLDGNLPALRQILKCRENVNLPQGAPGWRPLPLAAAGHNIEMVRLLLQHGAKPDLLSASYPIAGLYRWHALAHACRWGNVEMVRLLLGAGADPNAAVEWLGSDIPTLRTPLDVTVDASSNIYQELSADEMRDYIQTLQILLAAGADPNDASGMPVAVAAAGLSDDDSQSTRDLSLKFIEMLLDAGASPDKQAGPAMRNLLDRPQALDLLMTVWEQHDAAGFYRALAKAAPNLLSTERLLADPQRLGTLMDAWARHDSAGFHRVMAEIGPGLLETLRQPEFEGNDATPAVQAEILKRLGTASLAGFNLGALWRAQRSFLSDRLAEAARFGLYLLAAAGLLWAMFCGVTLKAAQRHGAFSRKLFYALLLVLALLLLPLLGGESRSFGMDHYRPNWWLPFALSWAVPVWVLIFLASGGMRGRFAKGLSLMLLLAPLAALPFIGVSLADYACQGADCTDTSFDGGVAIPFLSVVLTLWAGAVLAACTRGGEFSKLLRFGLILGLLAILWPVGPRRAAADFFGAAWLSSASPADFWLCALPLWALLLLPACILCRRFSKPLRAALVPGALGVLLVLGAAPLVSWATNISNLASTAAWHPELQWGLLALYLAAVICGSLPRGGGDREFCAALAYAAAIFAATLAVFPWLILRLVRGGHDGAWPLVFLYLDAGWALIFLTFFLAATVVFWLALRLLRRGRQGCFRVWALIVLIAAQPFLLAAPLGGLLARYTADYVRQAQATAKIENYREQPTPSPDGSRRETQTLRIMFEISFPDARPRCFDEVAIYLSGADNISGASLSGRDANVCDLESYPCDQELCLGDPRDRASPRPAARNRYFFDLTLLPRSYEAQGMRSFDRYTSTTPVAGHRTRLCVESTQSTTPQGPLAEPVRMNTTAHLAYRDFYNDTTVVLDQAFTETLRSRSRLADDVRHWHDLLRTVSAESLLQNGWEPCRPNCHPDPLNTICVDYSMGTCYCRSAE